MFKNILLFLIEHNIVAVAFYKVLYMSIIGSLVGLSILLIRKLFDKKISGKWKCYFWYILILTLLIPFRYEVIIKTNYTNNITKRIEQIENIPNEVLIEEAEIISNEESIVNSEEITETKNDKNIIPIDEETSQIKDTNYTLKNIILIVIIPYIWLIGIIIFFLLFIKNYFNFQKNIKKCNDVIVNSILSECKNKLNINKKIKLYFYSENITPSLYGICNPKILISRDTLKHSDNELKYVFMHEMAHFKRKDLIFNLVLLVTLAIHFFNPIILFIYKKIRTDIELATDEYVLNYIDNNETKNYGYTLLNFLKISDENKSYAVSYLCLSDNVKNMKRRIQMIKSPIKNKIIGIIIVLICIIAIASGVFIKTNKKETIIDKLEDKVAVLSEDYEHLWSEPLEYADYNDYLEKQKANTPYYEGPKDPTAEEMKNYISEEKAKEIARNILDKMGHENETITRARVVKNMYEQDVNFYRIFTNKNVELVLIAETGEFYALFSSNYIKENYKAADISEEEAKKYAEDFYKSCDFIKYRDFKLRSFRNRLHVTGTSGRRVWEAKYNEIYDSGILNNFKYVAFVFEIIDGKMVIHHLGDSDRHYDSRTIIQNNELKITEEQAIEVAKKEDQSFSGKKIVGTETFLNNNYMNYYVWLEKNPDKKEENSMEYYDEKEDKTYCYNKYYYEKNIVRNIYEVKLRYELDGEQYLNDSNYGRVYYVDVTTGEILGGRDYGFSDVNQKSTYLYTEDKSNKMISKVEYYDKITGELVGTYNYNIPEEDRDKFVIEVVE